MLGRVALAAAVFLLMASPYLLYIRGETGRWSFSGSAGMAFVSMAALTEDDPGAFDRSTWGLDPATPARSTCSRRAARRKPLLPAPWPPIRWRWPVVCAPASATHKTCSSASSWRRCRWRRWRCWVCWRARGAAPAARRAGVAGSLLAPAAYVPFFVQERYLAGALIPA